MTSIIRDFNNIAGELARRLASLFHFLKSDPSANKQADELGLTPDAEPKYWLYGLLSLCAKACEAKIEEANGRPVQKASQGRRRRAGSRGHRQNTSTNANSSNVLRPQSTPGHARPPYPSPARVFSGPASAQTNSSYENRLALHRSHSRKRELQAQ